MQCGVCTRGNNRVMRDHQNRFIVLADQLIDEGHDFIGALAVQVAGGLVAEQEGGVGNYGASDSAALLLSAGELTGVVMHAIGQIDDAKSGFDVLAAIRFGQLGQEKRKLDVLIGGEHGNEVVHL